MAGMLIVIEIKIKVVVCECLGAIFHSLFACLNPRHRQRGRGQGLEEGDIHVE